MRGRPCIQIIQDVPGYNKVHTGSAYSAIGRSSERIYTARAHRASVAAHTGLSEAALGLLGLKPVPCGFNVFLQCSCKRRLGTFVYCSFIHLVF
jgi:hypothetical protein